MNSNVRKVEQLFKFTKCLGQISHVDKLYPRLCFNMKKSDILKCRSKCFNGKIFIISSTKDERRPEVMEALDTLSSADCIGFDTETAVDFNMMSFNNPVSLVQLACEDTAVLWRLRESNRILREQFPDTLKSILSNPCIRKVGTASKGDIMDLYSHYDVIVSNVVDNQSIGKKIGFFRVGLSSLTAQLFGWSVSKARRLSNWEASYLNRSQAIYAATDAWASLLIYKQLQSMMWTLLKATPTALPSILEQNLAHEASLDMKLFRSLDAKIMNDSVSYHELNSLFQKKHERFQKRKSQKTNMSMVDMNPDFLETLWDSLVKSNSPSEYLNIEHPVLLRKHNSPTPDCPKHSLIELPFLYQGNIQ